MSVDKYQIDIKLYSKNPRADIQIGRESTLRTFGHHVASASGGFVNCSGIYGKNFEQWPEKRFGFVDDHRVPQLDLETCSIENARNFRSNLVQVNDVWAYHVLVLGVPKFVGTRLQTMTSGELIDSLELESTIKRYEFTDVSFVVKGEGEQ